MGPPLDLVFQNGVTDNFSKFWDEEKEYERWVGISPCNCHMQLRTLFWMSQNGNQILLDYLPLSEFEFHLCRKWLGFGAFL